MVGARTVTLKTYALMNNSENNWCADMSDEEQIEKEELTEKEVGEGKEAVEKAEVGSVETVKEEKLERPAAGARVGREQNVVYIGSKPAMSYVLAVITAFNSPDTNEVVLKARGRAITTAVDVAEILRNRFLKDAQTHSIAIGTEEIPSREGGNSRNVSSIEIVIKKSVTDS